MIGRLNHVAIAVPDLAAAAALYRDMLGAEVSAPQALPEHGVTAVFVELPNARIELLEPLGDASPVRGFLARNPAGGMHHVCYEVADIIAARDRLRAAGARVLGDGEPQDRRARQAGAVPPPQGFLRHADRARRSRQMPARSVARRGLCLRGHQDRWRLLRFSNTVRSWAG